ncbi:MAG TPA: SpoIIE family protein phosphatase [Anaerolineae bacterium]|nr:SpoIIE family protein phosphatase [Anaerolineae bacterium]HMR66379.1 SpoIIE family protein phosphatase [Anaerolineae bacterium]
MLSSEQFNIFQNFAKYWQETTNSSLWLVSPQGVIIAGANGEQPQAGWERLLAKVGSQYPTLLHDAYWPSLLAIALGQSDQILGYLVAGGDTEKDASLLTFGAQSLAASLSYAQALDDMTDELIGAWNQLELIYRVTHNLAITSDLIAILSSILEETRRVVDTRDGFLLLKTVSGFTSVTCTEVNSSFYTEALLEKIISANRVLLCEGQADCDRFWPSVPSSVQNLLATEIAVDKNTQAAIGLINKTSRVFTAGDAKLLVALAQQVAAIIKNYLTHEKVVREERLSRELEIAAEIQESLLPIHLPEVGGVSLAVSSLPASEVGGDFYDFVTRDDRYLTIVIGDVSGKGIPAAMLTSMARTMLRVEAMRGEPPHKIIQQANNVLHQDLSQIDSFVTVFVATIDTYEGELCYASAGHTPALIYRAKTKQVEQLKATSLPVGVFGYHESMPVTIQLAPDDILVFYTDGVIEARSEAGDFFGLDRLIQLVETDQHNSPETLRQRIQTSVSDFCEGPPEDDATMLIVQLLPYAGTVAAQNGSTLINTMDFCYPADVDFLGDISRHISMACREHPALPADSRGDDYIYLVELAISEICTNIIKHAYSGKKGEIIGQLTLLDNGVALDFFDQGESFDPSTVPEPVINPQKLMEGGFGLHIVRQVMDDLSYRVVPGRGNHWHMVKYLPKTES